MNEERKVVIYCSASYDIDQKYNQAAREVTRAACSLGYTIVSGGAIKGNRIGLYFNSESQCNSFGRQTAKVYILN